MTCKDIVVKWIFDFEWRTITTAKGKRNTKIEVRWITIWFLKIKDINIEHYSHFQVFVLWSPFYGVISKSKHVLKTKKK